MHERDFTFAFAGMDLRRNVDAVPQPRFFPHNSRHSSLWMDMHAYVYKSQRKADTYVYLAERDAFDRLPEPVRARLDPLVFVLDVALVPGRKLARENPDEVRHNLATRGFHLQMPMSQSADPMTTDWGTDA